MSAQLRATTTPFEAAGIVLLCFGWAIYYSTVAVLRAGTAGHSMLDLGGAASSDTNAGLWWLIRIELAVTVAALLVLRMRRYDVASLYPAPTFGGVGIGVALYLMVTGACGLAVAPFLFLGGDAPSFDLAASGPAAALSVPALPATTLPAVIAMAAVNGVFEEMFLLGFLLRGLRAHGLAICIGLSLLVRVSYHLYQGPVGAFSTLVFGAVLSLYYAHTGRLFPAVFAHVLVNCVPDVVAAIVLAD